MICPFCRQIDVGNDPGMTVCPMCKTEFEIDDRGKSVFVNLEKPRLPVRGIVCLECGLVQAASRSACSYCGTIFNKTTH